MLDPGDQTQARRRSQHPPFPRILCVLDATEGSSAAIEQALAVADGDATIQFVTAWSGSGSFEHTVVAAERARGLADRAVSRARQAGVEATVRQFPALPLDEALQPELPWHDLVVVGARPHGRATGILLGDAATQLAHRSPLPVLIARDHPLDGPVIAATRALPADRAAVTAGAHLAARLGAELILVHAREPHDEQRQAEWRAEFTNARALVGRTIEGLELNGPPARVLVDLAKHQHAGLVVVGSEGKHGLPALRSVSERVAHEAPCSVLVMRCR